MRVKPSQFDYINNAYGLSLTKNCAVVQPSTGRHGQVACAEGQYIHIRWDGEPRLMGPYHPTSDLSYPEAKAI